MWSFEYQNCSILKEVDAPTKYVLQCHLWESIGPPPVFCCIVQLIIYIINKVHYNLMTTQFWIIINTHSWYKNELIDLVPVMKSESYCTIIEGYVYMEDKNKQMGERQFAKYNNSKKRKK